MQEAEDHAIRLQVFLAHAGIASRRECERIISSGRITLNGALVTEPGTKTKAGDIVCIDGKVVSGEEQHLYLVMNKPPYYLCSQSDPLQRPLARSLLPSRITERLYTIGRLDFRSSGLVFWTNDGDFAAKLGHPSSNIEKEYLVEASTPVPDTLLDAFMQGITVDDIYYRCINIARISRKAIKIVLVEGKNREIRRVFSHFHLHAVLLRRIRIGCIPIDGIDEGKTRNLTKQELQQLWNLTTL